ncbi:MAG: sigma-54-dependent Fis family transcriptional regulator [Deltaproteobacteria bacterium]|nr:MAG: sigma-54-dependent Fis family transcriptional regulator [Deltaproteobacteria bacterium]
MKRILIIINDDDDSFFCDALIDMVVDQGHEIACASTMAEGLESARRRNHDIIFLDVQLPDGNGLDILPELKKTGSRPEIIVTTDTGNRNEAKLAIESGAWDYVLKNDAYERMKQSLLRAIEYREEKTAAGPASLDRKYIVGESPSLMACLDLVARAASSDVNVLITGRTGTGKELFARTVHRNSFRSDKGLIVVDCAALPETLVESTLFGHEKGAFTSAEKKQEGLVRLAHKGTLFLDEIGELPMPVQKSFLRMLQERRFRSVGGKKEIQSDFRLISATNRDLDQMVRSREFREDLLYRIRAITIHLPTLSQRVDDIRPLSQYYLEKLAKKSGKDIKDISPAFFEMLETYHWPGNVRELTNALESAFAALAEGGTLVPQHLPCEIRVRAAWNELDNIGQTDCPVSAPLLTLKKYRQTMTRKYLQELITRTKGDIRTACRISGVSRSRLYELLKEYDMNAN